LTLSLLITAFVVVLFRMFERVVHLHTCKRQWIRREHVW
jgi:hypothetical protein